VSKFHPFWCPVAQESKLGRKFLCGLDISGSFTGYLPPKPEVSSPRPDMSVGQFQLQRLFTILAISC
jgi:hypothetical protein